MIIRPKCNKCQRNLAEKTKTGFRKTCRSCRGAGRAVGKLSYRAYKKDYCENELCPIPPEAMFKEALEVHHINGKSDDEAVISVCCFCHRLMTKENRDWVNLRFR